MNFLAHFQLAWPDEGLVLGALEGDYYKGPLGSELPGDLARGVRRTVPSMPIPIIMQRWRSCDVAFLLVCGATPAFSSTSDSTIT